VSFFLSFNTSLAVLVLHRLHINYGAAEFFRRVRCVVIIFRVIPQKFIDNESFCNIGLYFFVLFSLYTPVEREHVLILYECL
jgi:hypothetical protein